MIAAKLVPSRISIVDFVFRSHNCNSAATIFTHETFKYK
jgi:hypothetical protein